jgi:hypothetical protein
MVKKESEKPVKEAQKMADLEKIQDSELDEVSGGIKYNIGSPVYVYDANAQLRHVLYPGDFLVTDGTYKWAGSKRFAHVIYAGGDGYVDSSIL